MVSACHVYRNEKMVYLCSKAIVTEIDAEEGIGKVSRYRRMRADMPR